MKLREIRTRLGITRQQLAELMGTTQQTVARWEAGKTQLSIDQAKDLSLTLQCSVEELLGWERAPEELKRTPFAVSDAGVPYGTLAIALTIDVREYPVDEESRESLLSQLQQLDSFRSDSARHPWLYCWTLDNKILLVNPAFVRRVELIGDDAEAMPAYEHPEVYRALDDWGQREPTGKLREACARVVEAMGEEAVIRMVSHVRVTYDDGSDEWSPLDEDASDLFALEASVFDVPRHTFVQVAEEGYYRARYVNLDRVAIIEIPSDRYHRMNAPDESDS